MKHDVFISYSRRDLEFVLQLEEALDEAGITYWSDRKDIEFGMLFEDTTSKTTQETLGGPEWA